LPGGFRAAGYVVRERRSVIDMKAAFAVACADATRQRATKRRARDAPAVCAFAAAAPVALDSAACRCAGDAL